MSQFCRKFTTFSILKTFKIFSRETHLFSIKKQILNVLRNLTIWLSFNSEIYTFSLFKKIQSFSENLIFFLKSKKKLWTFCENCQFQSHSTAKFQPSVISKWIHFFWESMYFFITATVWTFWEMLVFQLNSAAKLLPPANFYTFEIFVQKTLFLILKEHEVWIFWGLLQFQSILRQVCCLCLFKKLQFFSKTEVFLIISKSQKLNVLRNLTNSFALYSKFVSISDFWKTQYFFGKPIFFCKKPNSWTFREISLFRSQLTSNWLTVSVAIDIKLAQLNCFQKVRFLFQKNHLFFQNPNIRVILQIQSILRQVCYF